MEKGGTHKPVANLHPIVRILRLLTRGKVTTTVERQRDDLFHVVVRRAVLTLCGVASVHIKDCDIIGVLVCDPELRFVVWVKLRTQGLQSGVASMALQLAFPHLQIMRTRCVDCKTLHRCLLSEERSTSLYIQGCVFGVQARIC